MLLRVEQQPLWNATDMSIIGALYSLGAVSIAFVADWLLVMRLTAYYTSDTPLYRLSLIRAVLLISLAEYTFWIFRLYSAPNSMPLQLTIPSLVGLAIYGVFAVRDSKAMVASSSE
jgi:hypothetical protein